MKRFVSAILLLVIAPLAQAQTTTWVADKAHTQIGFSVTYLLVSDVAGRFTDFDVRLEQSAEDFSASTVSVLIKTASITTDEPRRDAHLRSNDFFNAEKFPELKFASTSFEKTGKDTYRITGDLTMRDVTKQVVLEATLLGTVTDQWGNLRAGFKATGSLNRMDYGIAWNKTLDKGGFLVSENVTFVINLQLSKKK